MGSPGRSSGSAHGHSPPPDRIVPADDEGQQKHDAGADGQHHEGVHIGQASRPGLHRLVDAVHGLDARIGGAGAGVDRVAVPARHLVAKCGIVVRGVIGRAADPWWNCARRASSVVTIEVPTLLPMLRMKLINARRRCCSFPPEIPM